MSSLTQSTITRLKTMPALTLSAPANSSYLGPVLTGPDDTKTLSKYIMEKYDKDRGGQLGHSEVANIMVDMYRSFNKGFTPSKQDIDGFARILDKTQNGALEIDDLPPILSDALEVKGADGYTPSTTPSNLGPAQPSKLAQSTLMR